MEAQTNNQAQEEKATLDSNPSHRIRNIYYQIHNLVYSFKHKTSNLTKEEFGNKFTDLLNSAQPKEDCETEATLKRTIHWLNRKAPLKFEEFLTESRLMHLILWTDSKTISHHFRLRNIVFLRWEDDCYHNEQFLQKNMRKSSNDSNTESDIVIVE